MVVLGQCIQNGEMGVVNEAENRLSLVVIDFSGTLSLGAVLFGREERLERALHTSGLWELGINSLDVFWNELVNPTWEEGSTTSRGYGTLLSTQVQLWLRAQHQEVPERRVERSARRFVNSYLRASRIDAVWGGVLKYLFAVPFVTVIIATDHYAEATAHIEAQLRRLELDSGENKRVLVVNSADVGAHKEDAAYWEPLRAQLPTLPREIILIDDFGANEHPLDAYASDSAIARRREATVAVLRQVFGGTVIVFDFVLTREQSIGSLQTLRRVYGRKVQEVATFLHRELGKFGMS